MSPLDVLTWVAVLVVVAVAIAAAVFFVVTAAAIVSTEIRKIRRGADND